MELAVELVNTDQRSFDGTDGLDDLDALKVFLSEYQDLWADVTKAPSAKDLKAIRQLRDDLRAVFAAPDEEEASHLINHLLAQHDASPRVSTHNGTPHLHFEPTDATMTSWLAATTAMGLATVLVENGLDRLGICHSTTCQDVYVDTTRNRSRLHCSTQCSTREAVNAYRKRARTATNT